MNALAIDVLAAESELARLNELAAIREHCGIVTYKPHAKQDLFHRAGKFKNRYLRTGNRFGKSLCGAAEDVAYAMGYRAWYPESDPARYEGIPQHANKIMVIVADWDQAELIFTGVDAGTSRGKLFKLIPTNLLVGRGYETNQAGKIFKVMVKSKWGGTSIIQLETVKSYKNNPLGLESADWDLIHVDEPVPEEMYEAAARGLVDRDGASIFCCTPLCELWINDKFLPPTRTREFFNDPFVFQKDEATPPHWMLTGSMHDNPNLSAEGKRNFISNLSEDERETRVDGRPRQLTGCIYKEFVPEVHVYYETPRTWKDFDEPPEDYTIRLAIDTHPKTPHAVLFAATAPTERVYFWAEIFEKLLISDLCDRIKGVLNGRVPMRILLEPGAWVDDPLTGTSIALEIMQQGLMVDKASKELSLGILKTKKFLAERDGGGLPFAQFSSALSRTPYEFDHYVWKPDFEKPLDKNDHMMECLYRLVTGGLHYIKPSALRTPIPKDLCVRQDFSLPKGMKVTYDMPMLGPKPRRMSPRQRFRSGSPGPPLIELDDRFRLP